MASLIAPYVLGVESNHTRIQTAFLLVDHHQLQAHTALSKAKQLNLYRR
ncbi:hypothetical protein LDK47_15600 [Lactiplantibacillus plantarum]|nr:hypothetical protein [Lactiplantibacillus plantarum]